MNRFKIFFLFGLLTLGWIRPRAAMAEDVVVVMSSNLAPYQAALAQFQETLGRTVPVIPLSGEDITLPSDVRVVVAIGGKAAIRRYPKNVTLVYCLAPGILRTENHPGPAIKVYMTPSASVVMETIREIQPGLQTLAILGLSESRQVFNAEMQQKGAALGVRVLLSTMENPSELPDKLRSLKSTAQALWIPPDPRLITPQNFKLIKEFCLANRIAFYVPTLELVEQGAVAAVTSSFDQIGQAVAEVVREVLAGTAKSSHVYPKKFQVGVNLKSAAECGLKLSSEQTHRMDKVIP